MRLAIDARSLFSGGTGDRTYFANLLPTLAVIDPTSHIALYARESDAERDRLAARYPNIESVTLPGSIGWLWNSLALPPRLRQDKMQVLHAQYLLPLKSPCPTVVTIHDITFRLFPQWFPKRACRIMNTLIPLAARRATRIITGSQSARNDMIRHFKVAPEKIVVTPYAASPELRPVARGNAQEYVAGAYGLQAPYIVGVGLRGIRKNTGVVLRAIKQLRESGRWPNGARLALTGERQHFAEPLVPELSEHIVFLGYVPDADLPALYSAAEACVYPSLYEGFGLPPLEAMACGCPVLSSNTSSLPEVVGDAGYLLPPEEATGWVNALEEIFTDPAHRDELREKGLARASSFSWDRTARQTVEVYRDILGG